MTTSSRRTLRQDTTSGHYVRTLRQDTTSGHYVRTLRQDTTSGHYVRTLRQDTTPGHYVRTLRQDTTSGHYVRTLRPSLLEKSVVPLPFHTTYPSQREQGFFNHWITSFSFFTTPKTRRRQQNMNLAPRLQKHDFPTIFTKRYSSVLAITGSYFNAQLIS